MNSDTQPSGRSRNYHFRRKQKIRTLLLLEKSSDFVVEDALDVTMAQQTELDYLIYNDPLDYADLILNGDPKEYLKNVSGSCTLED